MTLLKTISFITVFVLFGCTSTKTNFQPTYSQPTSAEINAPYKIQPGDLLDIKFFYNPELNEQVTVRSDGKISLQLVSDVAAAGTTPTELTQQLNRAYATEIVDPKVVVIVRTPVADKVYVDGEVNKAGLVIISGTLTAVQSIAQAGGMKETANPNSVIVIRRGEGDDIKTFHVDVEAIRKAGSSGDVILRPNDIVYVPKSSISDFNSWIDLYIRKNIPLPVGLGYSIR